MQFVFWAPDKKTCRGIKIWAIEEKKMHCYISTCQNCVSDLIIKVSWQ